MTKKQTLKLINEKIDWLIINGQTKTQEFKRLIKLHRLITQ